MISRKLLSIAIAGMIFTMIILLLLMSSCGPNYHLRKAIAKGAKIDTVHQVKYDTVKTEVIKDHIVVKPVIDYLKIDSILWELASKGKNATPTQKAKAINYIIKEVCPHVDVDTTYNLILKAQGKEYKLPITVKINSKPQGLTYSILTGKLSIPVKTTTNKINIKSPRSGWYYAGMIGLPLLIAGFALGFYVRGKGNKISIQLTDKNATSHTT